MWDILYVIILATTIQNQKLIMNLVIAYWFNVYTHFICTIVSLYIVHWMPLTDNIYDLRWLYTLCTCTELRSNWVNDLYFFFIFFLEMKIGICYWPIGNDRLVIGYCYCYCCCCCDWFLYWHLVCLLIRYSSLTYVT